MSNSIYDPIAEALNLDPIHHNFDKFVLMSSGRLDHRGELNPFYGLNHTEDSKKKMSETRIREGTFKGENNPMFGKKHTEETKNKLRLANKKQFEDSEKRQKHLNSFLEKNGNHRGTIWINNGIISKRVDHEDLISYIEKGNWIKGRMKKDVNFWKHSNRKRDSVTGRFTKK